MAEDMGADGLATVRLGKRERRSWSGSAGKSRRETGKVAGMRILAG
jgi:hypothetical protein